MERGSEKRARLFPHFDSTFITPTEEAGLGRTLVLLISDARSSSAFVARGSKECARGLGNVP